MGERRRFRVLVGLRLAGFAEVGRVAAAAGLDPATTEDELGRLAGEGLARYRDGRAAGVTGGWSLTPDGRRQADRLLAAEVDAAGYRGRVEAAYRRFLDLNPALLEAVTAWQVRDGIRNDHRDRGYDQRILDGLARIDEKIAPVLADLSGCLDRFGRYRPRLAAALARAEAGDDASVDGALVDSYHTIWFELHEDLLATLGLDRTMERNNREVS